MPRRRLIRDLHGDEQGAGTVLMALSLSAVLGILALGLNAATGIQAKGHLQAAADAAAHGGALALKDGQEPMAMAKALATENLGTEPATIDIEWPPAAGMEAGNAAAVRVQLSEAKPVLLASLLGLDQLTVRASATARLDERGPACLLALADHPESLDPGAPGMLDLDGCIALSNSDNISASRLADLNPYRFDHAPPSCSPGTFTVTGVVSFSPGHSPPFRCGGIRVAAGGHLMLAGPLVHLSGPILVEAGGRLSAAGATLAVGPHPVHFEPGALVDLRGPTLGLTAGIVILGQQAAPEKQSRLLAGAGQSLRGAIVLPSQQVLMAGNNAPCTQIVAKEIAITGKTLLAHDCAAYAVRTIALRSALLVE